jgi:hypothetical protein
LTSRLLEELAWLFKVESVRENKRGSTSNSMHLFCAALDLEEWAENKRCEELEAQYMGGLE